MKATEFIFFFSWKSIIPNGISGQTFMVDQLFPVMSIPKEHLNHIVRRSANHNREACIGSWLEIRGMAWKGIL